MSSLIKKQLEKMGKTDEDIIIWAKDAGHGSLVPKNMGLVRQIYLDAHGEKVEYPDLEMRGKRVTIAEIPKDEFVIIRVYLHKIVRTTTYPMCPEEGCYSRVTDSHCTAKDDKSHGYVAEPAKGIRHYYKAGDSEGGEIYVIVPAKYAMNAYVFENTWCDVKGIWNDTFEAFFASVVLPISEDEMEKNQISAPKIITMPDEGPKKIEDEEVVQIPKGLDVSMFVAKPKSAEQKPVSADEVKFKAELANFQQIIPFFSGHTVTSFGTFIQSNSISTPIEKLVEATPGCSIEGEGDLRRIIYKKP